MSKPRIIAYYLPQYHPIPENDEWWGKGFTEWTNVGKAKPLFPGHRQPIIPGELGYYDLRVPETRQAQADLAREYGIEGFCYWHYWFGNGKQLLERPFNEVLDSGKPDLPFCLAWANETWKGFWHGVKDRQTLIEQLYPGKEDYVNHFNCFLQAFKDPRYIRVDGKPVFLVYKPCDLPDARDFMALWNSLAKENGFDGFFFIGMTNTDTLVDKILNLGFDGVSLGGMDRYKHHRKPIKFAVLSKIFKLLYGCQNVGFYEDASKYFISELECRGNVFPSIIPNWDHSPRTKKEGYILHGSTPKLFQRHLEEVKVATKKKEHEHNLVFLKSWNEWGEGNYIEPDSLWGRQYLETLRECFFKESQ